ncbi:diacylglycerol kinase [Neolewinella antarctica]|uniref:Diacylglycerol kinase n=1 Tax=Neolewinella antarctica TaxID=442734 RepID=A0ABX0X7P0_9BACT|nr:diacylglycerol kinase family protein [Neolewinella antarctica]NJC24842.1 diacylglycerol kinase [Neolewinella antarctica]
MNDFINFCRSRWAAFGFAFKGAYDLLVNHAPSKIHLAAFVFMMIACTVLDFPLWKWTVVIICVGMVLCAEALNTGIEYVVDLVSPDYNILAGKAKDVAAAGVLFASMSSGVVAILLIGDALLNG